MSKIAAISSTQPNNFEITDVPAPSKRKVTYILKITTAKNLNIPYALSIDGKVPAIFASKPLRVSGEGGRITQFVDAGKRVALYLNSDAHPNYRKHPVYAITPEESDIEIHITEKTGKNNDSDTPILKAKGSQNQPARYEALLTGDIWMKVSHKYTTLEAETLIPKETDGSIKNAIMNIYNQLTSNILTIEFPTQKNQSQHKITIVFNDSKNPKDNISSYSLLRDGLTRVHPAGFAALFTAAKSSNATSIQISSCWRPLLGSIVHRAGLGLDVIFIGNTIINRQELKNTNASQTGNVSSKERELFKKYLESKEAERRAISNKKQNSDNFSKSKKEAFHAWRDQLEKEQPASVQEFRASLMACSCVKQIFDPWYMDANTHDDIGPLPNEQESGNERLHAHHLHITINDPLIL